MASLQLLNQFQNRLAVFGGFDIGVFGGDFALFVDDEGPAFDRRGADEGLVLVVDFHLGGRFANGAGDAEFAGDLAVDVGQQGEVQLVVFLEQLVSLDRIAADADHFDVLAESLAMSSRKPQACLVQPPVKSAG